MRTLNMRVANKFLCGKLILAGACLSIVAVDGYARSKATQKGNVDNLEYTTDLYDYSPNLGRDKANTEYRAYINKTPVDERPYIERTEDAYKNQYGYRRGNTRQLDWQNRRSGWRLVDYGKQKAGHNIIKNRIIKVIKRRSDINRINNGVNRVNRVNNVVYARRFNDTYFYDRIFFNHDKDFVSAYSSRVLGTLATYLANNPNSSVVLEGHTDLTGNTAYNFDLAQRRSQNARTALLRFGIDPNRVRISFNGEDTPDVNSQGKVLDNRRVVFRVLDDKPVPIKRPNVVRN